ncbi:unnamed protein product, partial [marine sediment metagenome]
ALITTIRANFSSVATEAAQSRTFFEQFVVAGGPIVWFILLPMSLITVYLAAEHGLTIRRKKLLPEAIGTDVIEIIRHSGPGQLEAQIADRSDFVSVAVVEAVTKGRGDWFRMRSLLAESLQDQAGGLLRRIEWLNLIGNVSPMVGLFGTVFGMIKLFNAIVIAGGQPQPAQLADGISVALVTTFWGLFIAIPALAIHGVFRNRIETLASDAVVEAENIIPEIRSRLRKQSRPEQPKQKHPVQGPARKPIKVIGKPSLSSNDKVKEKDLCP